MARATAPTSTGSNLRAALVSQFRQPHGWLGHLAGWVMATRGSNRQRNLWTIDLLDPAPMDRVLDIGCGPGFAVAALAKRLPRGSVVGLDHSDVMLAQARRRNRRAIAAGRVELIRGTYTDPPRFAQPFDRMLAVNSLMFSGQSVSVLEGLGAHLRPGGVLAVTSQSRAAGANDAASRRLAVQLAGLLEQAGFELIGRDELPMKPASAVCVRARRPG